ncbi:hypothetical protein BaRGS_00029951, partial [Batillaria attramentaria]
PPAVTEPPPPGGVPTLPPTVAPPAVVPYTVDWGRLKGSTRSGSTGPDFDHTGSGHYLYLEASGRSPGDTAVLASPTLTNAGTPSGTVCLTFWYSMYGFSMGTLELFTAQTDLSNQNLVWRKNSQQNQGWKRAAVEIDNTSPLRLVWKAIRGPGYTSDIAIDDVSHAPGSCPVVADINCDFDNADICGYTQLDTDDYDWLRNNGRTSSGSTGPSDDRTGGGYYMYTENSSPRRVGDVATLLSPVHTSTLDTSCLTFWYNMYGATVGSLNVYSAPNGVLSSKVLLWSRSGDQGQGWYKVTLELDTSTPIQLVFEELRGTSYTSDVAIDDVTVVPGTCAGPPPDSPPVVPSVTTPVPSVTPTFDCDFNTAGICGYQQSTSDDFNWSRKNGGTSSSSTGPSDDHGGGGHYMYTEVSWNNPGVKADLISPDYTPTTSKTCLTFWYHMYGNTIGTLEVYTAPSGDLGNKAKIWTKSGSQGNLWKEASISVDTPNNAPIQVIFRGIRGSSYTGDIAIDDITAVPNGCPGVTCDFDTSDICGWETAVPMNDFEWKRNKGGTTSSNTGPDADHTSGSGHYMYVEASSLGSTSGQLVSPLLTSTDTTNCVTFWYNMYGSDIGTLQFTSTPVGSSTPVVLWSKSGQQWQGWREAAVEVDTSTDVQVAFQYSHNGGWQGDVAIDDVLVTPGACPVIADVTCNFDSADICGYTDGSGDSTWVRQSGSTPSSNTGPSSDHTGGGGFYMHTENSGNSIGDRSELLSPSHSLTSPTGCLSFWYYMYGSTVGTLNVYYVPNGDVTSKKLLWSQSGDQGQNWIDVSMDIDTSQPAQSYTSDIAIDDVLLVAGACAPPPTEPPVTLPPVPSPSGPVTPSMAFDIVLVIMILWSRERKLFFIEFSDDKSTHH